MSRSTSPFPRRIFLSPVVAVTLQPSIAGVVVDFARACREHHVPYHLLTLVIPYGNQQSLQAGASNQSKTYHNPYVDIPIAQRNEDKNPHLERERPSAFHCLTCERKTWPCTRTSTSNYSKTRPPPVGKISTRGWRARGRNKSCARDSSTRDRREARRTMRISVRCWTGSSHSRLAECWVGYEPRSAMQARQLLPLRVSAGSSHGSVGSLCNIILISKVDGKHIST